MSTYLSTHRMLHVSRYFFGADDRPGPSRPTPPTDPQLGRREILEEVARALQAAGPGVTNIQAVVAATPVQPEEIDQLFGGFSGLLNALVEAVAQSVLAPLAPAGEGADAFLPTLIAFGQRVTNPRTALQLRALYRIAITDTIRDARLGQDFYARGPGQVLQGLARFLSTARAAGIPLEGDSHQLASHLMALLKGYAGLPDGLAHHEPDDTRSLAEVPGIVGMFCLGIQPEAGHAHAAH